MNEPVEFGRWYEQNGLHVMFDASKGNGTNAVVRSSVDGLVSFVHQLDLAYFRSGLNTIAEIESVLREVKEGGRPKRDALCFGDDRIRWISRLDRGDTRYPGGPLSGSADVLEVVHNEQYGGPYPTNDYSSRARMIQMVLTALGRMNE